MWPKRATLADRVLMIEDGEIALVLSIEWPRLRVRGSAAVAVPEAAILSHLFRDCRPRGGDLNRRPRQSAYSFRATNNAKGWCS
jgi:hypothetical protein